MPTRTWTPACSPCPCLLGLRLIGLAALARPAPWLVWNASAPVDFYRVLPGEAVSPAISCSSIHRIPPGNLPPSGYLPSNVPLVKRIVATRGDVVCTAGNAISINGRLVAKRLSRDRLGRPLPTWSGCQLLNSGEAFLLMEGHADSFDSRFFGAVPTAAIIGRLVPLWLE